jgi:hypothetical protein
MDSINTFFKVHGSKIIIALLVLSYFKSCSVDRGLNRLKKEVTETSAQTTELIKYLPTTKDLKIEGLNAEKRMIQATDRKMLDVQRQNAIENEIKILEDK